MKTLIIIDILSSALGIALIVILIQFFFIKIDKDEHIFWKSKK